MEADDHVGLDLEAIRSAEEYVEIIGGSRFSRENCFFMDWGEEDDEECPTEDIDLGGNDDGRTWVSKLKEKMSELGSSTRGNTHECAIIYKVPSIFRNIDLNAYEPVTISLGPYHRGKAKLKAMEKTKLQYLNRFVSRTAPDVDLDDYAHRVKELETRLRDAYFGAPHMDSGAFSEMMLLDACFVLEFLFHRLEPECNDRWDMGLVCLDMMRLENQIPFFLLKELLRLNCPEKVNSLTGKVYDAFLHFTPGKIRRPSDDMDEYDHILHLFVSCAAPTQDEKNERAPTQGKKNKRDFLAFFRKLIESDVVLLPDGENSKGGGESKHPVVRTEPKQQRVLSARFLKEAGVVFKLKKNSKCTTFLDITFHQGTMEIPPLVIFPEASLVLRNMIALEQCRIAARWHKKELTYVSAYARLMDFLIDTPRDVEILDGIMVAYLGSPKKTADYFNSLGVNLKFDRDHYLSMLYKKVNDHCDNGWNKIKALLIHVYSSSPWRWISFLAALFAVTLTAKQMILDFLRSLQWQSPPNH